MKRILVQAGHMQPLQPGHLTETGAPGEAALMGRIQRALVRRLDRDPDFEGVPMPGRIDDSVRVDGAIFLHADGAAASAARGYSLGFPSPQVNGRLAQMIAQEIEKLPGHPPRRPDNNTSDMQFYYGFHHVGTPGPEVLVEHGFVTNPTEHAWLNEHVEDLAEAEFTALRRFFHLNAPATAHADGMHHGGHAVTSDSTLHAAPRTPAKRVVEYLLTHDHGAYTDDEVRSIVRRYYRNARAVGLDPLLVCAQMVEETGHLGSFWSQPPRRNFAGIGVTGEPGVGLSFTNLKFAVRAHTGRLLAYAVAAGSESDAQRALIGQALAFRPLPDHLRGCAPTLNGLVGTWAADPDYADKLASVANDIRHHGG